MNNFFQSVNLSFFFKKRKRKKQFSCSDYIMCMDNYKKDELFYNSSNIKTYCEKAFEIL